MIAGGRGFLGVSMAQHFLAAGASVSVLSRSVPSVSGDWSHHVWDARTIGAWTKIIDGADAVVNLVGRTVNCIKTPDHQDVILIDRIQSDRAWPVGVVPFQMSDIESRGFPRVPWLSRFRELNVRTYVVMAGKPGVWFWTLDAANPVAVRVARSAFNLPYMDAKMSMSTGEKCRCHRRILNLKFAAGPVLADGYQWHDFIKLAMKRCSTVCK